MSGRYITTWGLVWGATKRRLSTLQPYWTTKEIDIEAFTTYLNCNTLILLLIRADSPKASAILFLNQPLKFLGAEFTGTCKGIPFIVLLFLLRSEYFFVGIHLRRLLHLDFNLETFLSNPSLQELKLQITMHFKLLFTLSRKKARFII